ncbi:mandelate racemase/muconate lactonizing enzyme family protein [Halorubrum sp. DTA98]|uniref:mandelate racemase/muconate lactonizing enzyme family protein n=1 Tax=Halorubrum sp. DTA98 TaxID=3402163 RepID=UPI003AB00C08
MRIDPFSLRLSSPLRTARAEMLDREGFLVSVDPTVDDVASAGLGEATPLPGWTESLSACEDALCGIGDAGPDALDAVDADATPAARHGLALALADADARDAGLSVAERLAEDAELPSPAASVPVNATIGDGSVDAATRAAERAVDDGYRCLKVKVGARGLDADVERLRAVRRAVGPAVELRADANGSWSRSVARRALDRFRAVDPAYVEQPLPADDLDGLRRLRADSRVPVAVDESLAAYTVEEVLNADATDVLIVKPMALGGPDEALAAARRARAAGVEPIVTTTVDGVVARVGAVHVAAAIPDVGACGLATGSLLAADLAPDPCPVEAGEISVPTAPGLAGDAFDGLR